MQDLVDNLGNERSANEEWLVRNRGSYLPGAYEQDLGMVCAQTLTEEQCICLRARTQFTDVYEVKRNAGEIWNVSNTMASLHIVDVHEELVKTTKVTVLTSHQFCYINDPYCAEKKMNLTGTRVVRRGPCQFFLHPNETLKDLKIHDVFILTNRDAILVQAVQKSKDENGNQRLPGETWMEYGPKSYVPPVEVNVLREVNQLALDKNEGIYVRDTKTGKISSIIGQNYMLKPDEVLYELNLPKITKDLLDAEGVERPLSTVVTYKCPFNACVQVFNYKHKASRIVFGPDLVTLGPDETITVNVLSGGKPKCPGRIKSLYIALGPDFTSDIIEVETSDHCRMNIALSYNWHFKTNNNDQESGEKVFTIRDFIGNMCTILSAKIRSAVASVNFENFHQSSAKLIRTTVFGLDENGKVRGEHMLDDNNLCITNIDIKSIEPIDEETQEALKQTISLAIETSTKTIEDEAIRQTEKTKKENEGQLERMKITYATKSEGAQMKLLELNAVSRSIKESGQANAEAEARAQADLINRQANVNLTKHQVQASEKVSNSESVRSEEIYRVKLSHQKIMSELRLHKEKNLTDIEASKFEGIMSALGTETLVAIANSGMESQVKLLEGLGLKGYLLTDGKSPINLFNAAEGMMKKN